MAEQHSTKKPFRSKQRRHTEEQKQEMIRLYQSGLSFPAVAKCFGCCRATVQGILRRRGVKSRTVSESITGHEVSEETRRKIGAANKGKTRGLGHRHSSETRRKMSATARARGESHNFRIDGKGDERRAERKRSMQQLEYRLWREAVFERDDYTCRECGIRGGVLAADHVRPWHTHPERRYDAGNGRTLCDACHKKTPTFGRRVFSAKRAN